MAKEVSGSFFEKKEPKKLSSTAPGPVIETSPRANGQSFFASFCSQKEESFL